MRVWLDVFDSSGARQGAGPVFAVQQAQMRRVLDGGGSFRATLNATDPRALELCVPGAVVALWGEDNGGKRLWGEGIIANRRITENPTGISMIIDGPDILEELKRKNTLLGRVYNQERLDDTLNDLISLVPGWSLAPFGFGSMLIDARFDGVNVLKAFMKIAEHYGFHLRASLESSRTLEFGPFATASGLRIHKVETVSVAALNNPSLLMVEQIQQDTARESNNYYNVLIPLGAGEGTAALTLEKSSGGSVPVQTMTGPDGRDLHYLATKLYPTGGYADPTEDPDAVIRVGQFKDIAPLSNSETDIENAANVLLEAAWQDLSRSSKVQTTHAVRVKNAKQSIIPGTRVDINYKARVERDGEFIEYLNVTGNPYILQVTERISQDGMDVELEISNVDRTQRDETDLVFNAIEQIELRTLKPNIAPTLATYVYDREIAPGFPAEVPVDITDAVVDLLRVRMRIKTSPFRSTASSAVAASGGGSAPTTSSGGGVATSSGPSGILNTGIEILLNSPNPDPHIHALATHDHTISIPSHQHSVTIPSHTHNVTINYGIADDTETPEDITVWFESTDVTNTLFGSATLAPSGGEINVLADPGELANLLINASGGLRQLHEIEIRCADGQGRVEVTIEVFETTQAIIKIQS